MRIRRVLALVAAVAFVVTSAPLLAQRNNNNESRPQRSKAEQADVETLVRLVDGVAGGFQPAPTDVPDHVGEQPLREGPGRHHLPAVHAERSTGRSWRKAERGVLRPRRRQDPGRAAAAPPQPKAKGDAKNQPPPRPVYPWDNLTFIEIPANGKLSRAIALKPGEYEAFIAIKEKGTEKQEKNAPPAKIGLLRHELTVPDFTAPS